MLELQAKSAKHHMESDVPDPLKGKNDRISIGYSTMIVQSELLGTYLGERQHVRCHVLDMIIAP